MTLNTSLIDRESQRLYMKYLKDPRIPDDICSDIYLEFIKRLEKHRQKQDKRNGKHHIEKNQLGIFVRWSLRTALTNRRKEKNHEEILTGIVERNASRLWCTKKDGEEQESPRLPPCLHALPRLSLKPGIHRKDGLLPIGR